MSNNWNKDLQFSKNMSTLVDIEINKHIPNIQSINRLKSESGQAHDLDIYFAIDGIIEKKTGIIYTFQEKIRRFKFQKYNDFTIEYYSNVLTKTKGEFFHLCSDFYFHGYSSPDEQSLSILRILDVKELKKYIDKNFDFLNNNNLKQNNEHSNANFFAINFEVLEKEGIVLCTINNHLQNNKVINYLKNKRNKI